MSEFDGGLLLERLVAVEVELFDAADSALRAGADGLMLIALLPLRVIAAHPGCRVQDLAAGLGLSVGGASKSADRLERAGWVRRTPHPDDRRSTTLELTAEGRSRLTAGNTVLGRVVEERVQTVLGANDAQRLSASLARIRRGDARPQS